MTTEEEILIPNMAANPIIILFDCWWAAKIFVKKRFSRKVFVSLNDEKSFVFLSVRLRGFNSQNESSPDRFCFVGNLTATGYLLSLFLFTNPSITCSIADMNSCAVGSYSWMLLGNNGWCCGQHLNLYKLCSHSELSGFNRKEMKFLRSVFSLVWTVIILFSVHIAMKDPSYNFLYSEHTNNYFLVYSCGQQHVEVFLSELFVQIVQQL